MSDGTKMAAIAAIGVILATAIYIYFSPYQTCVRAVVANGAERGPAQVFCTHGPISN